MNEWGVVGVIVVLVSFVTALVAPIIKLNTNITKLTVLLDEAVKRIGKQEENSHNAHKRLWDKNGEQDKIISENSKTIYNHKSRISRLENGGKKNEN